MRSLRICIGSNDGARMADTHLGDTRRFLIFDLFEDQTHRYVEERQNIVVDRGHASAEKMKTILHLLDDVDLILAQKNSANFCRIAAEARHQPVVVQAHSVQVVLATLGKSFLRLYEKVVQRRNGARTETLIESPTASDSTADD